MGTLVLVVFALLALATANGGCGSVLEDADGDFDFGVVDDEGDEEAVAVLQTALARCNGHPVAIDGEYGPETEQAVMAVQREAGVGVDGAYGPVTLQAMRWPATTASGVECVTGISQLPVVDDASPLPSTRWAWRPSASVTARTSSASTSPRKAAG